MKCSHPFCNHPALPNMRHCLDCLEWLVECMRGRAKGDCQCLVNYMQSKSKQVVADERG